VVDYLEGIADGKLENEEWRRMAVPFLTRIIPMNNPFIKTAVKPFTVPVINKPIVAPTLPAPATAKSPPIAKVTATKPPKRVPSKVAVLHAVVIDDQDMLIDGRARLEVGWAITLDPPIIRHDPSDALNYVLATNYYRKPPDR
jgi:hypothetical protein